MEPSAAPIAPQTAAQPTAPRVGRFRRGLEITKSSWNVLKLDKELATLPLLSIVWSVLAWLVVGAVFGAVMFSFGRETTATGWTWNQSNVPTWMNIAFGASIYLVSMIVANFFSGAIIYGAVERFKGGDPTVKSSIAGAKRKFRPLLLFSLMMATVGYLLQMAEERLPFAGKIAAYLFDAAWNIANIFAIPVIVLSDEEVSPFDATKRSVGVIKKVWGEGIVADLGIGLVALLVVLVYAVGFGALLFGAGALVSAGVSGWIFAAPVAIGIIGALVIGLVFSAVGAIAKAALYQYAVTGKAPANFKSEVLQSSMTPKKARKIFA